MGGPVRADLIPIDAFQLLARSMAFELQTAVEEDSRAISEIYNHYVDTSTCTFDLQRESIKERIAWLREHGDEYPVLTCRADDRIVGWGALSSWNPRPGYARTAEVSFYVHHDWHRQGIGKLLLGELISRARKIGHHVLIGGACTEQLASIRLQESFGFTEVARFTEVGRKFDRWLDVCYLQLNLQLNLQPNVK